MKTIINPMEISTCGAKARTNGHQPCRKRPIVGKRRCYMHGGAPGSGAPKGNKNALKHGLKTREAKDQRSSVKEAIRKWRKLKESNELIFF